MRQRGSFQDVEIPRPYVVFHVYYVYMCVSGSEMEMLTYDLITITTLSLSWCCVAFSRNVGSFISANYVGSLTSSIVCFILFVDLIFVFYVFFSTIHHRFPSLPPSLYIRIICLAYSFSLLIIVLKRKVEK